MGGTGAARFLVQLHQRVLNSADAANQRNDDFLLQLLLPLLLPHLVGDLSLTGFVASRIADTFSLVG